MIPSLASCFVHLFSTDVFLTGFDSIRIILWAACFVRLASSDAPPTASGTVRFTTCDAESVQAALAWALNGNFRLPIGRS
jgi:hypothetical protein